MFEKREVRFFPGLRRDDAWRKAWDWWGRQGFQLTKTGPYRMHGSSFYSRIGLRREFDAILDDADGGPNVDLTINAQITDEGLTAGPVTAAFPLPAPVLGAPGSHSPPQTAPPNSA